jgi:AcrR family transcriptional regulator
MLGDRILACATELFLRDGYASTSMEAVASAAGVSKRTLYKRYADKPALLHAAIAGLIERWLPGFDAALDGVTLEVALVNAARRMLTIALAPEALALNRLMISEAARFPEIVRIARGAGTASGIAKISALLRDRIGVADPVWAAEQFQHLVLTGPIHRALGLGEPLSVEAQERWARESVALFLRGIAPGAR